MIYLDNSATTKPDPEVLASFTQVSEEFFGNPSSLHHFGGRSEKLLGSAREQVAKLLEVKAEELVFTSGGTEGNNLILKGIAHKHRQRGKHMITTAVEHPSVLQSFEALEKEGFRVTYLPVNESGQIDLAELEAALTDETILLSVMQVNNEMGTIQPIQAIGQLARQYPKLFFHVDAVQGLGKIPLKLKEWGIDSCTFSGHKIHGLKGTGIVYMREGLSLQPLFTGGEQEFSYRSGTENLAGAVSMARALRLIKEKEAKMAGHLEGLRERLLRGFQKIDGLYVNSPADGAAHIINVSLPGLKPEVVIHALGEAGIYISTRSACSSKSKDESHVLAACGLPQDRVVSSLRISTSYDTEEAEIDKFLQVFAETVEQLKRVME